MRAHPAGPRHGENARSDEPWHPGDSWAFNAIDRELWPTTARRDVSSGVIEIGGCDVRDLVDQHGSPLFVVDEVDFRIRASDYREAFDDVEIPTDVFYAAKAFICTTLAKWVIEEGLGIDVCTGGELECVLRAGIPGKKILMHGNNKSTEELAAALDAGVGHIVVDSFEEIARLGFLAAERGVRPKVFVRVTVGVEAHTHEFIATAHEDQKFGFSLASGAANEAVDRVLAMPDIELAGLHSHIGSQIFVASGFEIAASRIVTLLAEIRDQHGVELEQLNLGGGLGIKYVPGDQPLDVGQMAIRLREIIANECAKSNLAIPRLAFEPGRAIVGPSTITLYTVGTVKRVDLDRGNSRLYVSVDGGMSDNIRTALYDAEYTATLASRASQSDTVMCRVVGKHCESGDIVVTDVWLPEDITPGDVLAVAATGAYNRSMASNYNMVPKPGVVSVKDGDVKTLLRRETLDDLWALDPGAG